MDEDRRIDTPDDYLARENLWDEQWPGTASGPPQHSGLEPDNLDEETPFPGVVGTTDSIESVRDAEPYTPATDPPVLPGGREGIHVATGFGQSPEEETYRDPAPRGDEDLRAQIALILQQDSFTNDLPLEVHVQNGVVYLRGVVASADDADRAGNIIQEYVPGVVEVVDETRVDTHLQG